MSPALRLEILDALMQRWRAANAESNVKGNEQYLSLLQHDARAFFASCIDMIMPVAESLIVTKARHVALKSLITPATEKEADIARKRAAVHGFADALDQFILNRSSTLLDIATIRAG